MNGLLEDIIPRKVIDSIPGLRTIVLKPIDDQYQVVELEDRYILHDDSHFPCELGLYDLLKSLNIPF